MLNTQRDKQTDRQTETDRKTDRQTNRQSVRARKKEKKKEVEIGSRKETKVEIQWPTAFAFCLPKMSPK